MTKPTQQFIEDDSGAVTVDWVVLTAAMVGLGVAAAAAIQVGVGDLSQDISDSLEQDRGITYSAFGLPLTNGGFDDVDGMMAAGWGFYAFNDVMSGCEELDGERFEVKHSGYQGIYTTDGGFSLDMDASPGNLTVAQTLEDARDGTQYTVSFEAADYRGNNGVEVWFGGEMVGDVNPTSTTMTSYSFEIEGGAGDGDNRLELRGTGPEDNYGAFIDNVVVR